METIRRRAFELFHAAPLLRTVHEKQGMRRASLPAACRRAGRGQRRKKMGGTGAKGRTFQLPSFIRCFPR